MLNLIQSQEEYHQVYQKSIDDPKAFWGDYAKEFLWRKPWDNVFSADYSNAKFSWFEGAELNITENCIDRHLEKKANQTAIIWEPNDPHEAAQHISYADLHQSVCQVSNMLKTRGIRKGDRVCLYMPMIPELAYAVLACARIGAIHSVVFAGFSQNALRDRINDASCKMVLTADGAFRGEKITPLKSIVDEALNSCPTIKSVIVVKRTNGDIDMKPGRDFWWHDEIEQMSSSCQAETMAAEDPLFILYTSGSTGKPKGMLHTCAGYMVYTAYTFQQVFQYKPEEIYWCTADIGWITGHSYILYGPLSAGATTMMFEGVPTYPNMGRFWEIVDKHRVNIFYTAPTAIRALAQCDQALIKSADLSSLRVLGTVGEPINEEAWEWYNEMIGKNNCPIVDTWWQTETGGIMISALAGVTETKATYATTPLPGIEPALLDENGNEISDGSGQGKLCIKSPWPAMARTIYGDHQRFIDTYYKEFPGYYFTGDGCRRDDLGNYRITGRVDDVVIVSGHNLGTAEIENAIDEHPLVAEAAVVGYPHPIKGNAICAFITMDLGVVGNAQYDQEILDIVSKQIGPIAKPEKLIYVAALPKTRSGKIMRRILRKVAAGQQDELGDISTLLNPECVEGIVNSMK
jgi:acetyl-CoA synthetase